MTLPSFKSVRFRRSRMENRRLEEGEEAGEEGGGGRSDVGDIVDESSSDHNMGKSSYTSVLDIKRATRTRRNAVLIATLCFIISVLFLILVLIGNTSNTSFLRNTYFFYLDLANIIPESVPDAVLINSIAQSLGLHDFYQVGLWNFCEGYNGVGITSCSKPTTLYWFNPVEILLNELLSGATIALPADINSILNLIKLASQLMFGFFLVGAIMNFICVFVAWIVLYTRLWAWLVLALTFISALLTTAATVIATVMFIIFRDIITSQDDLNIGAFVGIRMFAFMWTATAFSLIAFIIHLGLTCCCASRRDVRTGRKRGSRYAYGETVVMEKHPPMMEAPLTTEMHSPAAEGEVAEHPQLPATRTEAQTQE